MADMKQITIFDNHAINPSTEEGNLKLRSDVMIASQVLNKFKEDVEKQENSDVKYLLLSGKQTGRFTAQASGDGSLVYDITKAPSPFNLITGAVHQDFRLRVYTEDNVLKFTLDVLDYTFNAGIVFITEKDLKDNNITKDLSNTQLSLDESSKFTDIHNPGTKLSVTSKNEINTIKENVKKELFNK